MAAAQCLGAVGLTNGHNYQPRYDEGEPVGLSDSVLFTTIDARKAEIIAASKSRTYVCDVCTRCGDVIKPERKA